ncbi:MAG: hypothetical protein GC208_10300 [Alphaproteobacteria bacterium]|nr:hypothetical protein [Alphaproteobacteria bacterium]
MLHQETVSASRASAEINRLPFITQCHCHLSLKTTATDVPIPTTGTTTVSFTNVDGNNISSARMNMDAIRYSITRQLPARFYVTEEGGAAAFNAHVRSGTLAVSLTGNSGRGYLDINEETTNANTVDLDPTKMVDSRWTLTAQAGLTFSSATLTIPYNPARLNGLTETAGSLNAVFRVDGSAVTEVNPANVSFNYAANTVTVTGITGFSTWFIGNDTANDPVGVDDWQMLAE